MSRITNYLLPMIILRYLYDHAYFITSENHPIALIPELHQIVRRKEFADQMHDIIQYRTMNYYQQRYSNK